MKLKLKALLAILLVAGLLLIPCPGDAYEGNWLDDYGYRKLIPIAGQVGAGTDYQVPLTVYSGVPTEEQTQSNSQAILCSDFNTRVGQRLTISNRTVTKLSFRMESWVPTSGDVTLTIRKVSDNSTIVSKVWGDASDIPDPVDWIEVTFDTPTLINEEVRILVEFSGGQLAGWEYIRAWIQESDVKSGEYLTRYVSGGWSDTLAWDCAYKYTYLGGDGIAYLDNLCTDFPNDIRFTDDDGDTELGHWCEDLTADPAKFRIKVDDDLDDNQSIYIYWGKAGASSASNGAATFIIFNDGSSIVGWTSFNYSPTNRFDWAAIGGVIKATGATTDAVGWLYCDTQTGINSYVIECKIRAEDGLTGDNTQQGVKFNTAQDTTYAGRSAWLDILNKWNIVGTAEVQSSADATFDARDWHLYKFVKDGSDWELFVDGASKITRTEDWSPQYVGMFAYTITAAGHWIEYDDFRVRKYVDPEPVVGTSGSLETRERSYGYIIG